MGDGVSAPGSVINQRHLAEESVGGNGFHDLAVLYDVHLTAFDHEHFPGWIPFSEDDVPLGKGLNGGGTGKNLRKFPGLFEGWHTGNRVVYNHAPGAANFFCVTEALQGTQLSAPLRSKASTPAAWASANQIRLPLIHRRPRLFPKHPGNHWFVVSQNPIAMPPVD